ncbi:LLM class flavin-dependent oxidoreductase [Amycolatopsis suaedae]|uniref:LLM class flavin-dependent oxidoreductase n=1 Tax=Amycolatopsis suaedae TaxID=2510978 RepID=A0A4Q7JB86_9PSEU|nr:LLM class flavin-dependent oxidoreductase [Amycolatopsis suaedae]RZQ63753.1 LLM class flavin-dependent oxidoreductase [Amycolatopsis suaedae]
MDIGVILPSVDAQRQQGLDLRDAARHAEAAGLDSVWLGDHLATGTPVLDSGLGLATAAAVTERVRVGISVFVPAIRPVVWAAKQIASLQYLSGGRLILGIGSGGGAEQWAAAEVPFAERGPRTDRALRLLPDLLAGKPTLVDGAEGETVVELAPAVAVPPLWVGNHSAVARRRAVAAGDAWFPSLITAERLAAGAADLAERSAGRAAPAIAIGGLAALGDGVPSAAELGAGIAGAYGMPLDQAVTIPLTGTPEAAAERLAAYAAAGASHAVLGVAGPDWRRQVDLLARTRSLME